MKTADLEKMAKKLRLEAVKMVYEGKDGHPGPALSIADIVTTLYFDEMKIDSQNPNWEDRDRFVISKGHACPIVYAALNEKGFFGDKVEHFELRKIGSMFQGHPVSFKTPGIDSTSGSLGNGIAIGSGMAIAAKLHKKENNVFVITGDGELQEGICWEGINIAASHKLNNLIVFVDKNNWQSGGSVTEILGMNNINERFKVFGWHVQEICGHDIEQIKCSIQLAKAEKNKPSVIVCNDIKGKGLDYMENDNNWHKGVPTNAQYVSAIKQLGEVE